MICNYSNCSKFCEHFASSVLKWNIGYQGWNSVMACRNSKQERPWSDCFCRSIIRTLSPYSICLQGYLAHIECKILTLCIRETPKRVLLQTVKTMMKCSIITVCKGIKRSSDERIQECYPPPTHTHLKNVGYYSKICIECLGFRSRSWVL